MPISPHQLCIPGHLYGAPSVGRKPRNATRLDLHPNLPDFQPSHGPGSAVLWTMSCDEEGPGDTPVSQDLVKKVVPSLPGSIWSQWNKKGKKPLAPALWATNTQVQCGHLSQDHLPWGPEHKSPERSSMVKQWMLVGRMHCVDPSKDPL
ncbi:hypothetical protein P7K49_012332 [Saguinus oedipus]|uniref:Uncharacterized protein n=1 Tax=Saguinus oedipus TaxID=9490 RepID=A0ABQ9VTS5_SAGOE|nr:hypothetical protein P7K49_012332 [Saguinus oedipus]